MKLNHIDLQVPDVQATAAFFERHFGFAFRTNRTSPAIVVLDGDGVVLVLQRKKSEAERYPDGFHVGFIVAHVDDVVACQRRLRDAGVEVTDVERNNRGTMMYCRAPGEIAIEVSCPRAS